MAPNPQPPAGQNPPRYSASQLPLDADPAEKEFVGLLHKALAPSYVLIRRLGAGGMGTVYVARDPVLKRLVAVKVMSPELSKDPEARARFQREAQAVAAISHPNVVSVYAVGELENGLPFLVMQYVEGRSMAERLADDGPLDVPAAKRVLGEVASALTATHRKGIIHRDIKPANILWDDEAGRALVTDFGIAAVLERPDEHGKEKLTQAGTSVGTPAYMSPEQLLAEPVTEKSDIYALGLLGYELMTGAGPYAVTSPRELMAAHLRDVPRKLSALRGEADAELEHLLIACLEKDPAKRPTAEHVAGRLTHGASALLEWPPPGLEGFASHYDTAVLALIVGGFLVGIPLVGLSALSLDSTLRQALPSAGALVVLTSLGVLMLMAGSASLVGLFRKAIRAASLGYGWYSVAEAACDSRGDTGALIAGGREYAALSPAERNTLRGRRMAAGGLRLAGALMPVAGYVAGLVLAVRLGGGAAWLALTSLGLGVAFLTLSRAGVWMEAWQLRTSRARMSQARAARAEESRLGESWTATFDEVRAGQRLGPGIASGLWKGRFAVPLVAGMLALSLASMSLLAYSMAAIGSFSEVMFNNFGGGATTGATARMRKIARLGRLRLPVDPSITPMQAGDALHALNTGREHQRQWNSAVMSEYIRTARRLPPARRDTLRRYASDSRLAQFRLLAHARTYDFLGTAMPLGRLDSLNLAQVPVQSFTPMANLTFANIAAGILAITDGKPAEAETRFRETLSVGFLLIHEGTMLESWIGASVVAKAQLALATLYEQSGRSAEATFVSAASDPADAPAPERQLRLDQRQTNLAALRVLRDTTMLRGLRMEMLHFPLAYGPCGDLQQVVFGVDPGYTRALEQARKTLVRFPSDSVLFLKATLALERPMRDGFSDGGVGYRVLNVVAHAVDFLTGSKRMQSCVSMLS